MFSEVLRVQKEQVIFGGFSLPHGFLLCNSKNSSVLLALRGAE